MNAQINELNKFNELSNEGLDKRSDEPVAALPSLKSENSPSSHRVGLLEGLLVKVIEPGCRHPTFHCHEFGCELVIHLFQFQLSSVFMT
jgi:hypothetical protein